MPNAQRISLAEFRRRLPVGQRVELTHCLMGPVVPPKPRVVERQQSNAICLATPEGHTSWLYLVAGSTAYATDETLRLHEPDGELATEYRLLP